MMALNIAVHRAYLAAFGEPPVVVRSPGRINIIGEHTDYNEGFVMPAAIDRNVWIAAGKRNDDEIHLQSVTYNETWTGTLHIEPVMGGHWSNYLSGVAYILRRKGYSIGGFNMVIASDLPVGAGLSSSAALECASVFALNEIFKLGLDLGQMMFIAQASEHVFAGVLCGIMDQFASTHGRRGFAMKLDCRSLEFDYIPFDSKHYRFLLINSHVSHSLAGSEYNLRREECGRAVSLLQQFNPEIKSLRDANLDMLHQCVKDIDPVAYKRSRYVVEEIGRLQRAAIHMREGRMDLLGQLMYETHQGLSASYEVSCAQSDFIVQELSKLPGVLGARMMGGGFGGCTLQLVDIGFDNRSLDSLHEAYHARFGINMESLDVFPDDGTALDPIIED